MFRKLLYTVLILCNAAFSLAQVKTEEILIKNNDIELPGTLTYTKENTPLIIWVHGSGNVDRNGNQQPMIKANYIKQFRDSINKNDIAFYSFDKRTATPKNIQNLIKGVDFTDFSADVEKVISYFQDKKQFSKIILIGHSQGSLVAMLASKNIDKYISLAGSALSADQVIVKQIHQQAP
ncbi:MAG: alpha/beta hydrolase, partial [Polaribacter sp.]|nr:alpha/beta hydrolase [Polaribacter sp.]